MYFVTSYPDLQEKLGLPEPDLQVALLALIGANYIKCLFPDQDTEVPFDPVHFETEKQGYFFLATKAGLLNHNSR
nr:hypothetical protein [Rufibacter sp. LB8]